MDQLSTLGTDSISSDKYIRKKNIGGGLFGYLGYNQANLSFIRIIRKTRYCDLYIVVVIVVRGSRYTVCSTSGC